MIKIDEISHQKPYVVKGTGVCYIRVNKSTTPASRAVIINLVSDHLRKRNSVIKLRAASRDLIEQIHYTSTDIENANPNEDLNLIKPLNLHFFQNAVLDTEWLFEQNNLLGGHQTKDSEVGGYYMFYDKLERLNLAVTTYNQPIDPFNKDYFIENKKRIKDSQRGLRFWHPEGDKAKESISFLKHLIVKCDDFEKKIK